MFRSSGGGPAHVLRPKYLASIFAEVCPNSSVELCFTDKTPAACLTKSTANEYFLGYSEETFTDLFRAYFINRNNPQGSVSKKFNIKVLCVDINVQLTVARISCMRMFSHAHNLSTCSIITCWGLNKNTLMVYTSLLSIEFLSLMCQLIVCSKCKTSS